MIDARGLGLLLLFLFFTDDGAAIAAGEGGTIITPHFGLCDPDIENEREREECDEALGENERDPPEPPPDPPETMTAVAAPSSPPRPWLSAAPLFVRRWWRRRSSCGALPMPPKVSGEVAARSTLPLWRGDRMSNAMCCAVTATSPSPSSSSLLLRAVLSLLLLLPPVSSLPPTSCSSPSSPSIAVATLGVVRPVSRVVATVPFIIVDAAKVFVALLTVAVPVVVVPLLTTPPVAVAVAVAVVPTDAPEFGNAPPVRRSVPPPPPLLLPTPL